MSGRDQTPVNIWDEAGLLRYVQRLLKVGKAGKSDAECEDGRSQVAAATGGSHHRAHDSLDQGFSHGRLRRNIMSTPDTHARRQRKGRRQDHHRSRDSDELRPSVPILRIFKARAKRGCEGALGEKLATTSTQLVRDQSGLLGFLAAGPTNNRDRAFVFATIWCDADALKAFFGQEWRTSLLPPGYLDLIEACSVEHYHLTEQFSATEGSR
jgi:hypothetical protein